MLLSEICPWWVKIEIIPKLALREQKQFNEFGQLLDESKHVMKPSLISKLGDRLEPARVGRHKRSSTLYPKVYTSRSMVYRSDTGHYSVSGESSLPPESAKSWSHHHKEQVPGINARITDQEIYCTRTTHINTANEALFRVQIATEDRQMILPTRKRCGKNSSIY